MSPEGGKTVLRLKNIKLIEVKLNKPKNKTMELLFKNVILSSDEIATFQELE